ncbi:MAG TPA: DUF3239 domain-containing protein [Corynebacteriales bacterium]|nr:DUF3239 domain-containing protein [Mycobacteriales bacterium]
MPSRTFEFPIDKEHANRYNELVGDRRRSQVSALILTLLLGVGTYFAYIRGANTTLVIILCVLTAIAGVMIVAIPLSVGSIEKSFHSSNLAPAMVADSRENGLTLLALVNIAKDDDADPVWALSARDVRGVPGIRRNVREKVPCVAVTGSRKLFGRKHKVWDLATPMPIAWGTPDRSVVKEARNRIPGSEWHMLEQLLPRLDDVRNTPNDLLVVED